MQVCLLAPLPPVSMLVISCVQDPIRPTLITGGGVFHFFINCPKYFAHDCLSFCSKTVFFAKSNIGLLMFQFR